MNHPIPLNIAERKQKGSAPRPKPTAALVTEDSAAQQFARLYDGRLRYDHSAGSWYEWTGARWQQNRTRIAFHWARELARDLVSREPDKVRYVSSKTAFARGVEAFSQADPTFAITSELWNRDPFLLGTPGGTVDLRTGVLRAAHPDDAITKLTAVAPAESSACPRWRQFMHEACGGDADRVRFLQQVFGYALTGDTREHALFFLYGSGGNGKSVFLNALTGITGDYSVTASMDTFTASKSDKHPTELAMLNGARLVTASETEEGRAWAESRIKALTGGDPITARFMRQDFFTFLPAFKLVIVGNHKPVLSSVDEAARRRFNIVPFNHKPAQPDRDLERKLRAEYPGILRWAIEGCLDWQKHGLVRPQSVIAETNNYFSDQDLFGQWLEDECELEPGNTFKTGFSAELYGAWQTYAKGAGENPGSQKGFADQLRRRGAEAHKGPKGVRMFRGIRLTIGLGGGN